jgi:hypothetical protein
VRAAGRRCRLEIWPEQLVVVNSFTTCRIRREELLGVAEQDWSNLADTTRTIELRTVDGGVVRVLALARVSQTSAELRHHAERITLRDFETRTWRVRSSLWEVRTLRYVVSHGHRAR